jgi:hypothetical protein
MSEVRIDQAPRTLKPTAAAAVANCRSGVRNALRMTVLCTNSAVARWIASNVPMTVGNASPARMRIASEKENP